jgi:hypothetical protein
MAEKSKEGWPDEGDKPAPTVSPAPSPTLTRHPTREAMSWIRALANDWEDERSHTEIPK